MVLLGGHPSDALNKPVDDVVEFEVLNLDMTQSARISFHKSTSETVGLTINGQHFFEVDGTSAVVPSACLMEGTNTLLFASPLGHPVAILDVQFDVTVAKANGASVLNSALESNFIANAFESDNARSSDLSFALKSHQTAAIPLSLSNVTRGATAYRSAASDKVITVKIGVQRTLGQSQLREAQVMYFDYTSHSWQKAFVKGVDHENFMVEADVPGGTDYFAALIKTPEMPEAAAFMPTAISDLEPKTPAEGITLIQPPTANQQGDANVSYPLSLPPGRQGMAPQLALSYSSSGGESWCGYGWNIATQSISVDTRWGVPTFDQNLETEVYSLDGQSLHGQNGDKANRPKINGNSYDPAIREPGPQNFFTRTQGGYRTIVRYGDTPGNYYWVVTDANQTKFYYGTKDGKVADLQSELRAGSNITQWYLSRVEDKWGNVIDYTYTKDTQYPAGIRENGTAMWLSKITYTGFVDQAGYTPGKYTVEFVTSKGRVDDRISMNKGLKLIDDRKLTDVVIKYDNQEVKRFKLDLQAGYFNKTKLAGISEWHEGATGSEKFYEHTFDYYGSNELTYTEKTIAIDHRNADAGTIPDEMDGWLGRAMRGTIPPSVLSSSSTVGWKGGRRYGVGYDSDYSTIPFAPKFDNLNTLGYQYSRGDNLSITKHQMLDVNGDGIPDIVMEFATGTKMYRPGIILGTSDLTFGEFTPIKYNGSFATHSSSNQLTLDWTGKVDFRGISLTNSHSAPLRSFADYNSDGVLDVLEQGFGKVQVRFGRIGDDGALHFESSSENTLNPVLKGQEVSSAPSDINKEPIEIVRYWKAPKDGTVSISGTASCVSGAEGTVKVAVQKNGVFELPFTQVTSSSALNMAKSNISVTKGDILMFRTHYNIDGYEDFISWNPAVTYTSGASIKDGAGNAYFNTSYSSGFLVSSPSTVLVNADDEIELDLGAPTGYTAKSDLHFVIRQMELDATTGDVIDEKRYVGVMTQGNNTFPTSFLDANGASATFIGQKDGMNVVDPNSQVLLSFEVLSTSNINWQDLQWRPVLRVTNPNCPDVSVSQYPVVDKVVYNELLENDGYQSYSGSTGTLEAFADISINQADLGDLMQDFSVGEEVVAYLTTKSGGKTLSEKAIVITKKISGHTIEYKT
ncbi:MAG TPA: hypothetical protein DCE52_09680, partial [Rhodobacteraceae bacterium]|nr:hypothetical protein [Paracoccaceae bacterium]